MYGGQNLEDSEKRHRIPSKHFPEIVHSQEWLNIRTYVCSYILTLDGKAKKHNASGSGCRRGSLRRGIKKFYNTIGVLMLYV